MQFPELEQLLRDTFIFSRLPADQIRQLEGAFSLHLFQAGETIVTRGQPADGWCIVCSGRARVLARSDATSVAPMILERGDTFGDRSLIESGPSPYTVRAESGLTLLALTRAAFERVTGPLPDLVAELHSRIARNAEFEFFKRLRIFSHLPPDQIEAMMNVLPRASFLQRTHLFNEDDPSECCYLIRRGRIQLLKHVDTSVTRLATRREGDLVGEMELLYGTPRIADALVDADADVLVFTKELLDRFMPEGGAREVLFQVSTERLLQYQNMLADVDTQPEGARLPALAVQWLRVPGRLLPRRFPVVSDPSPLVAGLACLTMVDGFNRRESAWHDRLEQFLWERQPDTLLSLSRTIEECGYFTRLVTPRHEQLRHVGLPALIEDDDGTLAVLFDVDADGAIVANPLRGIRHVEAAEFRQCWNGQLLTVVPVGHEQSVASVLRHAPQIATAAGVAILVDVFGLGGPLASKAIVDRVLVDGDLSMLRLLLVAVLAMVCFQLLASVLREYLLAYTTRHVTLSLQRRFLDRILHLRQSVAATHHIGDLAVRFRENEALAERAFRTALALLADTAAVLLYLAVLWWLSRASAVIALAFVCAYAAVTVASSPLLRRMGRRSGEARQAVQSHLIEAVSGIQTIKSLAAEHLFFERGRRLMLRLTTDEFRATRLTAGVEIVGAVLHLAALVAIVGTGAHLVVAGQATTGDMVASLGLFGAMLVPLNGLIEARDGVRAVRALSASLDEVRGLETEASPSATVPPVIQGHVVLKDVSFRYPGSAEDVLTDINLEVVPGQRVALVGRSGSGKTTLVNLLMALYEPTRGTIYIDHVDIGSIPKSALRRQIGVVEQHAFLFEGTIRDNISKADPSLPLDRIAAVAALVGAQDFIDALPGGFDTPVGERGTMLSGGEKQQLMIARAIVGTPRMLILDEATSAVDSGTESLIQRNLGQAITGRTTFVIAHRLSTVRDADLIVVLDRGRIVETGTHAELMDRRGLYFYLNTRSV